MMNRFVKNMVFIGILLVLFSASARAETMYVSEVKITFRRDPGSGRKILDMLPPGQMVEVLEKSDEWAKVRLLDGKEGWVLDRYLTAKKPDVFALEALKKEHSILSAQVGSLREENGTLKKESEKLREDFSGNKKLLDKTSKAYKMLKADCANPSSLRRDYEKTIAQFKEQRKKAAELEEKLKEIQADQGLKWFMTEQGFKGFLYGALVLFVGFLAGFLARRQPRHSSFL